MGTYFGRIFGKKDLKMATYFGRIGHRYFQLDQCENEETFYEHRRHWIWVAAFVVGIIIFEIFVSCCASNPRISTVSPKQDGIFSCDPQSLGTQTALANPRGDWCMAGELNGTKFFLCHYVDTNARCEALVRAIDSCAKIETACRCLERGPESCEQFAGATAL